MIASYSVPWVALENPNGWDLALEWVGSRDAGIARTGWATLSGFVTVTPDEGLDLGQIENLVDKVAAEIHTADNFVKSPMNTFVISVGSYVLPLSAKAKDAARKIGVVIVDVGDTDCKIKVASDSIAKIEASGKVGVKRKSIRC
jgi:hypothetical protein